MTLIFIGHNFKYEIEAVCKLFFPVQAFSFLCFDNEADIPMSSEDRCILTRKVYSGYAELTAGSTYRGKTLAQKEKIPVGIDDYEHLCELTLCKLLFRQLRDLSGITPKWGILTGVRPVKLISRLMASGMSETELCEHMQKNLYVTEEKIRLGLETSKNQSSVISGLPKNSVSLYVSIPFCPSRCAYCSFVSQTVRSFYKLMPEYVDKLCQELSETARIVRSLGLKLDTVYFGGGTPTSLEASDLERIMQTVSREFDMSSLREYTVEAGRPDTVTREKLKVIRVNGGDRVSVNPQTMQDSVLEAIGRKHTVAEFLTAYEMAKQEGFKAVNVDLIAGLPTDTFDGFCDTLRRVISLDPENITVHALSIKRAADLMQSERELNASETSRMIDFSNSALTDAGYKPYYLYRQKNQLGNLENVGWEKGGTAGIYNINMMEEIQTVLAVGAGGSTKIVAGEQNIRRFYNPKYPLEYIKRFDETVIGRKSEAERAIAEILQSGNNLNI